jgi:hypothetical protein
VCGDTVWTYTYTYTTTTTTTTTTTSHDDTRRRDATGAGAADDVFDDAGERCVWRTTTMRSTTRVEDDGDGEGDRGARRAASTTPARRCW